MASSTGVEQKLNKEYRMADEEAIATALKGHVKLEDDMVREPACATLRCTIYV